MESPDTPDDFKNSSEYIFYHIERFRKVLIVYDVIIQNFKILRKYIMKNGLRHNQLIGHFRKTLLFFLYTRSYQEYDAKVRLSIPSPSPEQSLAEKVIS